LKKRGGQWAASLFLAALWFGAAGSAAVEEIAEGVAEEGGAEDFGCVGAGVDDVDEWIGGDEEAEERGAEAGDGGPAEPAGEGCAESGGSDEWDGEHGEVGEFVLSDGGVGEDLEGLLRVDAYVCEEEEEQDEGAGEGDRVDGGAVAGVKTGEPGGDEVVPAGDEGETGDSGEDEAGGGDEAELQEQDGEHGEEAGEAAVAKGVAEVWGMGAM
jgi:hypothetical protein